MKEIKYNKKNWSIKKRYKEYKERRGIILTMIIIAFGIIIASSPAMMGVLVENEILYNILILIVVISFIAIIFFLSFFAIIYPALSFEEYYQRYINKSRKAQERKSKRWLM